MMARDARAALAQAGTLEPWWAQGLYVYDDHGNEVAKARTIQDADHIAANDPVQVLADLADLDANEARIRHLEGVIADTLADLTRCRYLDAEARLRSVADPGRTDR